MLNTGQGPVEQHQKPCETKLTFEWNVISQRWSVSRQRRCDNTFPCCVGSSAGKAVCQHQLLTSNPFTEGHRDRACVCLRASYEHVDSAAHAVFLVLVMHDGPVVQQALQQTHHQSDEVLAWLGQVHVLPAVLQQTGICWFWVERERNNFTLSGINGSRVPV